MVKSQHTIIAECDNINSAFMRACRNDELYLAQELYHNYDVDLRAEQKNDLFCRVCQNGFLLTARWLKMVYPEIDHMDNFTALQYAITPGHKDVVEWLISIWSIERIEWVIFLCYKYDPSMIEYAIKCHDLPNMVLSSELSHYQERFDRDIEQCRRQIKSARKI